MLIGREYIYQKKVQNRTPELQGAPFKARERAGSSIKIGKLSQEKSGVQNVKGTVNHPVGPQIRQESSSSIPSLDTQILF